jgi:hypothetical protein
MKRSDFEKNERVGFDRALAVLNGNRKMKERTMELRDFGWALNQLRAGKRVARDGWNGKGMWIELQVPGEHSKMTLPYIFMSTVTGDLVPWLASQTDLLADDWTEAA